MDERRLKMSRRTTEYVGCNEHQDAAEIHLQEETVKRVKTFTYLGDGELDAEVTHRVQSGWKNWKRVSGPENEREDLGEGVQNSGGKTSTDVRGRDMGVEEGT